MTEETIQQLIQIPSTADRPDLLRAAIQHIRAIVDAHPGLTCESFESNNKPSLLVYVGKQRPERFRVLLNGHVDVVAAKAEQFKPIIKDSKLYGRGAVDMKAAAIVLTEVFCQLAPTLNYRIGLQIVSDEEVGGHNGTKFQIEQGVETDFVLAGEFTPAGQMCLEAKGLSTLRIHFKGKAAHSAYLWKGENAAVRATSFVNSLLQAYPIPQPNEWATTINVATLHTTNTTFNQVPDAAEVVIDCRYIPGDDNFKTKQSVEDFIQGIDPTCEIEHILFEPAQYTSADDPLVKKLAAAVQETYGAEVTFIKKPGASDARHYSSRGATAVVFGVQGDGLHSDTEYVELASIEKYRATLTSFLASI